MDQYRNTGTKPRSGQVLYRNKPIASQINNNMLKPITNHSNSLRTVHIHKNGSNTYLRKDQHRK